MPEKRTRRVYQFGEFRLDADERLLLRRGRERVQLSPRTFALLVALVENAGHLLEKEVLMREVWAGSVVEEGNLNRTISNLRKALGEKPDENRFIETIPRVGYRFIAEVNAVSDDGERQQNSETVEAMGKRERAGDGRPVEVEDRAPTRAGEHEPDKAGRKSRDENRKPSWLVPSLVLASLLISTFGFFVWQLWRDSPAPKERDPYAPVRLTESADDDSHPRWTRDGRIRFYRTGADRQSESWIMSADGANQTAVKDFPNLKSGVWSPDGQKIIFARPNDRTAYYLANADGTDEVALPFYAGNFDWSSDSKRIVYQKSVTPSDAEIFVYSLDTKESRNATNSEHFDADPSFSPDGRQIVFVSSRDGNSEIYLANADGGDVRRVTNHPAADSHPVFSPDGTQIAFTSDREDENADVYLISLDGSNRVARLTDWKTNETVEPGCWSPDGTQIAFYSDRNGRDDIYVVSAEVFRPQSVLSDAVHNLNFPSYSPDGKRIVYQAELPDRSGELRVSDLETKQIKVLANNETSDLSPAWSPGGEWIAFQKKHEGNTEIFLIRPDGSGLKNLTDNAARDTSPSWSPDGRQIVFNSNRDGNSQIFQLYLMNADGSNQHRIYSSGAISASPAWSPDGRQIVFANDKEDNRTGNFEIFLIEPETGEPEKRLTFRRRFDTQPAFSPDGRRIAFVSEADGNPEIYLMNADGTGLLRLTRNPSEDVSPRWSPDGTKIIFSGKRNQRFGIFEVAAP